VLPDLAGSGNRQQRVRFLPAASESGAGCTPAGQHVEDVEDRILVPIGPLLLAQLMYQPAQLLDHVLARISDGHSMLDRGTQALNRVVSGERISPNIPLIGHGDSRMIDSVKWVQFRPRQA
jgi:hypothetical protein